MVNFTTNAKGPGPPLKIKVMRNKLTSSVALA